MPKNEELSDYLREHYAYELMMLRYTHRRLRFVGDQLLWNALFESCVMHARNLRDFYTNKGGNRTYGARDFGSPDIGKRNYDSGAFQKMNEQMEHLSTQRVSGAEQGKLTLGRVDEIVAWLEECHLAFVEKSSAEVDFGWSEGSSQVHELAVPVGSQPSATNVIVVEAFVIDPITTRLGKDEQ